jgi:hypothetical protein
VWRRSCCWYVASSFSACRMESLEHALQVFARLVRILLGPEAIAEQKLECGPSLCVLGVDIAIGKRGFKCRPAVKKVDRWIRMIDEALEAAKLLPGTYLLRVCAGTPPPDPILSCGGAGVASKLAGKLSWGCSQLFRRLGRAMLRSSSSKVRVRCCCNCVCVSHFQAAL